MATKRMVMSVRISDRGREIIDYYKEHYGVTRGDILDMLIKEKSEQLSSVPKPVIPKVVKEKSVLPHYICAPTESVFDSYCTVSHLDKEDCIYVDTPAIAMNIPYTNIIVVTSMPYTEPMKRIVNALVDRAIKNQISISFIPLHTIGTIPV